MKKLLSVVMCGLIVMSFAACGNKTEAPKTQQGETQSTENKDNQQKSGEQQQEITMTEEELKNVVNEFNTTKDPERKEELRQKISEFLKQAENKAGTEK